jgi:prolyl-tRNA synthetase
MRYSQTFIPTVKEVPADAEIISHQLMIRAGLMRRVASGTYIYLPAGWKVLRKIMQIVREEMDATGALEMTVPVIQPLELWQQTAAMSIMAKRSDNSPTATAEETYFRRQPKRSSHF